MSISRNSPRARESLPRRIKALPLLPGPPGAHRRGWEEGDSLGGSAEAYREIGPMVTCRSPRRASPHTCGRFWVRPNYPTPVRALAHDLGPLNMDEQTALHRPIFQQRGTQAQGPLRAMWTNAGGATTKPHRGPDCCSATWTRRDDGPSRDGERERQRGGCVCAGSYVSGQRALSYGGAAQVEGRGKHRLMVEATRCRQTPSLSDDGRRSREASLRWSKPHDAERRLRSPTMDEGS